MASTLTTALRLRGFAALTTTIETIAAGPGLLDQKVYAPAAPKRARAPATKRVMIASGRHRFTAAGTGTLRLKLTAAGRRTIRHAKSLKLTIVTRFAPAAGNGRGCDQAPDRPRQAQALGHWSSRSGTRLALVGVRVR